MAGRTPRSFSGTVEAGGALGSPLGQSASPPRRALPLPPLLAHAAREPFGCGGTPGQWRLGAPRLCRGASPAAPSGGVFVSQGCPLCKQQVEYCRCRLLKCRGDNGSLCPIRYAWLPLWRKARTMGRGVGFQREAVCIAAAPALSPWKSHRAEGDGERRGERWRRKETAEGYDDDHY